MKPHLNQRRGEESDTMRFHRKMYERRLRVIASREGRTEKELVDEANDPAFFRRAVPVPSIYQRGHNQGHGCVQQFFGTLGTAFGQGGGGEDGLGFANQVAEGLEVGTGAGLGHAGTVAAGAHGKQAVAVLVWVSLKFDWGEVSAVK